MSGLYRMMFVGVCLENGNGLFTQILGHIYFYKTPSLSYLLECGIVYVRMQTWQTWYLRNFLNGTKSNYLNFKKVPQSTFKFVLSPKKNRLIHNSFLRGRKGFSPEFLHKVSHKAALQIRGDAKG